MPEGLEQIAHGFESMCASDARHSSFHADIFNACVEIAQTLTYHAKDIETFALTSTKYRHTDLHSVWGYYVSALACVCKEPKILIPTKDLPNPPLYVGSHIMGKEVRVEGNVGNFFGMAMRSGRIELNGNAGWGVGSRMRGGELIVNGNAGLDVGDGMDGSAIIRLNGSYDSISKSIISGTIYHHQEKIWPHAPKKKRRR